MTDIVGINSTLFVFLQALVSSTLVRWLPVACVSGSPVCSTRQTICHSRQFTIYTNSPHTIYRHGVMNAGPMDALPPL
ncbi:uncharacterized protein BJ212DRAFT_1418939 [Suillus subaureus]|uniref:Secreted protein n=1 Tax=Suillus subaureus TaxID=48587 RepID=A0A9P7AL26_9AGAM|nr:uncharacterized protein BJ212DRAFT_1418939 [Suillus subaureus]KAG1791626.1 hypothetical protein BJ212DRAFT_1418939 [Suillus subaureus]